MCPTYFPSPFPSIPVLASKIIRIMRSCLCHFTLSDPACTGSSYEISILLEGKGEAFFMKRGHRLISRRKLCHTILKCVPFSRCSNFLGWKWLSCSAGEEYFSRTRSSTNFRFHYCFTQGEKLDDLELLLTWEEFYGAIMITSFISFQVVTPNDNEHWRLG